MTFKIEEEWQLVGGPEFYDRTVDTWEDVKNYIRNWIEGWEETVEEHGYDLLEVSVDQDSDKEEVHVDVVIEHNTGVDTMHLEAWRIGHEED